MALQAALKAAYARRPDRPPPFRPPPEAPLFRPSREEFADPLAYIAKIRAQAEPCGICRIRPPPRWQPPFALDVDSLRFVPRVQRLAELEGLTRLRLHFDERLRRYWRLRGAVWRPPVLEGRRLDLFALYHAVRLEGGAALCATERRWPAVAAALDYAPSYGALAGLRHNYDKWLQPFHDVCVADAPPSREPEPPIKREPDVEREGDVAAAPNEIVEAKPLPVVERGSMRRLRKTMSGSDVRRRDVKPSPKCNRELQRLACYGAGPKMPGCEDAAAEAEAEAEAEKGKKRKLELDPLAVRSCEACGRDDRPDELVSCEGCAATSHARCLERPLSQVPAEWRCDPCIAEAMRKPLEAFGFAQAEREYSLQEFGEMADRFKRDYFGLDGREVSSAVAEREFWRIVCSPEEDVTVEYGADLHSMDHGSGFPTRSSTALFASDQEYVDSGWNLNNLPILDGSVLRFINDDISGMTVPWMYVGMCFSAFCWHNEDHWSYSINFLHWGEAKTWYGVPGASAELLEATMKSVTPDLFASQPDLLHQLVTILNPNVLGDAGVPIYRTDQAAGEFVVTFPRSYHAGFNQGYNFAEAVNFAPPDWLSIGRECVLHYKNLKRFCVFSHDELICKMGLAGERLELSIVIPTYKDLASMVQIEAKQRGLLAKRGVRKSSRRQFELLQDDERLCEVCKTTCFLSALTCAECSNMVCLDHFEEICSCGVEHLQLHYRYNLDELHVMIQTLKSRIQSFDDWMTNVKKVLRPTAPLERRADDLKDLIAEAADLKIPKCKLLERLRVERDKLTKPPETIIIELDD